MHMLARAVPRRLAALPCACRVEAHRLFGSTARRDADFTHAVVGGGVVGLAVARALAARPGTSTLLVERHGAVGTETSSRNSEVIHAGLYYPPGSLKARLCVRGRDLLYAFCARHGVAHRRTGKWLVAQTPAQRGALERVAEACRGAGGAVAVRWVGAAEAARREPAVRAEAGVLESPATGIVDSHGLMMALLGQLEDAGSGTVALGSRVVGVRPLGGPAPGRGGWELTVRGGGGGGDGGGGGGGDGEGEEESVVTAETLVNAAGLGAVAVHNMIVPPARRRAMHYAKGNYFSYGASAPRVGTLVYPAPEPGLGGLGTHLTLDLAGRIRFGPDVEWVASPDDLAPSAGRLPLAAAEIRRYLPGVDAAALRPDYAGIRPKLGPPGAGGFQDFVVGREEGYEGWVNLLGIESPGLTSCLAIAERVDALLYS